MADLNAFNGGLFVDENASIGARKTNANNLLKLEVTSFLPDQDPAESPIVGITTTDAEDFMTLSCGNREDQVAQLAWNRGSVCFGTNVGFDRTAFSESLRITEAGNIGLGTPDPQAKLHIDGGTAVGLEGGGALVIGATGGKNVALDTDEIMARDNAANSVLHLQAEGGGLTVHDRQAEGEKFVIKGNGKVGIGTSEPGSSLHVADHMVVGPFAATTGQGGIDVTGSVAEFGFVRRNLNAWPDNPQSGDRFVWYNPDGTARLWTHDKGDLLSVAADGAIDLRGSGTLLFSRTNASGMPTGDGFRIRYDNNFFGTNADGLIFEKTDGNHPNPEGGIAFVNTGNDGVVKHALTIRGDGRIGIGTSSLETKLKVEGGSAKFVTNSGKDPLIISRLSEATATQGTQELRIGVGDGVTTFHYINDEAVNRLDFHMENTDTETGGGANANGNTVMSVVGDKAGGKVGIGTTSPGGKLEIKNGEVKITNQGDQKVLLNLATDRSWQFRQLGTGAGTALELASVGGGGNKNFVINTKGRVGIGTTSPGGKLEIKDGEVKITNQGNQKVLLNLATDRSWQFRQLGTGAGTALELASIGGGGNKNLVINTKGGVGIGTTRPTHPLHMGGGAYCDGKRWKDVSSIAYKEKVTPLMLDQALTVLAALEPVTFKYKDDNEDKRNVGFIAEAVPELVASADRRGLSAMDIVAVLTRIVQEQQKIIETIT